MSRPRSGSWGRQLAGNPLLLGAVGILVLCTAIVIAVTATRGLPFVPTYNLTVQVPNAAQVARGGDVTISGTRVGQVSSVTAVPHPGGRPTAKIGLALQTDQGPLPVDSTFQVRISGSLGRKSIAITPGVSTKTLSSGSTVALAAADEPVVDLDQVLGTFTAPVRAGASASLEAFALGFAGRGQGLNRAIAALPSLLTHLQAVMRGLADPRTGLERFIVASSDLMAELAPVSGPLAQLQGNLNTTFSALASVAGDLQQTIQETPQTLEVTTASLATTQPFLQATTALMKDLQPATVALAQSTPSLATAFAAGAQNLPLMPALNERLTSATNAFAAFAQDPVVRPGVNALDQTATSIAPLVSYLTPAETTCYYPSLLVRNLSSLLSEGYATGKAARVSGVVVGVSPGSERGPSHEIYQGPVAKALGPLHSNPYPYTSAPGVSPKACAAGHEPYVVNRAVIGNPPPPLPDSTESPTLP